MLNVRAALLAVAVTDMGAVAAAAPRRAARTGFGQFSKTGKVSWQTF